MWNAKMQINYLRYYWKNSLKFAPKFFKLKINGKKY